MFPNKVSNQKKEEALEMSTNDFGGLMMAIVVILLAIVALCFVVNLISQVCGKWRNRL